MSTSQFDVLHALKVKGLAADAVLAALTGLSEDEVTGAVDDLVAAGFAVRKGGGRLSGTMITPAGRSEYERLAEVNALDSSAAEAVSDFYQAFGPINTDFKATCAAWQLRADGTPNDHSDVSYDAHVIEQLAATHDRLIDVVAAVRDSVPRLGRYAPRLEVALSKVKAGDNAAFARPMYDSYHDIWMELHQDLLLTAGRERGAGDQ